MQLQFVALLLGAAAVQRLSRQERRRMREAAAAGGREVRVVSAGFAGSSHIHMPWQWLHIRTAGTQAASLTYAINNSCSQLSRLSRLKICVHA
jgi:hypothetical protein